MIWSAAAGSFGGLLLARLFLGVVTAAAPLVASLTGGLLPGAGRGPGLRPAGRHEHWRRPSRAAACS
jgi:hypothetical protein